MIAPIGYFRLWRELYTKPIWLQSTPEQKAVLFTLLAMANFKENEWEWSGEKFKVNKGQFVTSLESIKVASGKGISIQNVRSSLKRFEKLGFLTNKSTKQGRLITILNWALYQPKEDKPNKANDIDPTKTQQSINKDPTPIEKGNKDKKEKKKEEDTNTDPCPYSKIINYLNEKTGKGHSPKAKETRKNIKARWNEGYGLEDFIKAIDNSYEHWSKSGDLSNMKPSTLFNGKFGERVTNDAYGWKKEEKYNPIKERDKKLQEGVSDLFPNGRPE